MDNLLNAKDFKISASSNAPSNHEGRKTASSANWSTAEGDGEPMVVFHSAAETQLFDELAIVPGDI